MVSILTRSFDRMQRWATRKSGPVARLRVSILTRSFDRMQRRQLRRIRRYLPSFNPHPVFRPDATGWLVADEYYHDAFQSSSGRKTGCNVDSTGVRAPSLEVSILIRSKDRMQPLCLVFLSVFREPPSADHRISSFQAFSPCRLPCVQLRTRTSRLMPLSHMVRVISPAFRRRE